ncbi:MAG: N(4)-(beta-N-acetylglucosaminyl)-L-asparaginase [Phycisphaerae bacterium]
MGQMAQRQQAGPRGRGGPIVISSANGVPTCNKALELIRQGADPLDAVVAGINLVEDDPNDHAVGYGGLPNEDGVVELDSCVMHGPAHKAGAVAGLRNIRNPSSVAKLVLRRTDHVLLVGEGALRFAKAHGFKEQELLTDEARRIWLKWKESHSDSDDWLHPEADQEAARWKTEEQPEFTYGTISCMALTEGGDLAGCTSTSGLSYKIPGRVGDSPIIGAGLYVDNDVGACGSTGRGEANLQNCSCFMVVEFMRNGMTPEEACLAILKRVAKKTEPRLRDENGKPSFGLKFYALRKDGLYGGASMWDVAKMTVHDGTECRTIELPSLCGERPEQE